jgi:hypothetical protein
MKPIKLAILMILTVGFAVALAGAGTAAQAAIGPAKVHLKLSGGWSFLADGGGDLELIRKSSPGHSEPSYEFLNYSFDWKGLSRVPDWKAELLVTFGRYFGVGLGIGKTRLSSKGKYSKYGYTYDSYYDDYSSQWCEYEYLESYNVQQDFQVSALSLQFNVYGLLPLGRFIVYAFAGPGYYTGDFQHGFNGRRSEDFYWQKFASLKFPDDYPYWEYVEDNDYYYNLSETAEDHTFGFQGGLGLEFRINPHVSFGFEALVRRVNFNGWKGTATFNYQSVENSYSTTSGWDRNKDKWTLESRGPLWYYVFFDLSPDYYIPMMSVSADQPTNYWFYYKPARPAEINFHAFDLLLTLRIHF